MLPYFRIFFEIDMKTTYKEILVSDLFQVDGLNYCTDDHIGRCIPGSEDEIKCDNIWKQNGKGGHCKVIDKTPSYHFCPCLSKSLHTYSIYVVALQKRYCYVSVRTYQKIYDKI